MDALSYQYLIRKAYNCGPSGAGGRADASIYQKMENIENAIKKRASADSNGDIEYIYRSASINVSVNIYEALIKVVDDFHFNDENKKFKKRLEKLANNVHMSTDRKIIDNTIEAGHKIFEQLKLHIK